MQAAQPSSEDYTNTQPIPNSSCDPEFKKVKQIRIRKHIKTRSIFD